MTRPPFLAPTGKLEFDAEVHQSPLIGDGRVTRGSLTRHAKREHSTADGQPALDLGPTASAIGERKRELIVRGRSKADKHSVVSASQQANIVRLDLRTHGPAS